MARKKKETNEMSKVKRNKKPGIFQILLLWIVIPLLFALAVTLIIAKFADVNVFDKAKEVSGKLPFIGDKKEKEDDGIADNLVLEDRAVTLQAEIQEKEAQLFTLQQDLDKSADENKKLLVEQERLLDEIEQLIREKDDSKRSFQEVISTFEKMSAKSAAPVIVKMSDAEAMRILISLKPDTLAPILEKMTPEEAAKYTSLMSNTTITE